MTETTPTTPVDIDTALAAVHGDIYTVQDKLTSVATTLTRYAGAKFYYRGRRRVTDMKLDEAIEILTETAAYIASYKASHSYTEVSEYNGRKETYTSTNWDEFDTTLSHGVQPYDNERPAKTLALREELEAELVKLRSKAAELQALYTGWSRFFLVTSSPGHVHSSTSCSTCRPTTRFGWLPHLSGRTEDQAVKDLGPTLCTVCYPGAPVEWTSGKKITPAQAAKRVA